ncbi:FAD/NAD(P)-binding protein [Acrocarpospora macrocephala]|uniref:FAD-dependent urate hydroxylase HpyO/Asp monooxygenase CreE-like FAD/NAD(P)-binding domain-containing protein n=1 Tax=Acrocarpospora macrocephala TaxID=150177 RepID=A0A5M3WYX7_9ACTN|nr:FAD/NAD(P)-binding protein [Acrocarpospora macrocephala]GES12531.1 hypothetical protein Amac_061280 [Acrocarpospora macrocephala]
MSRSHVIVVVGGGASGTLAAVHLLYRAGEHGVPLHVVLIDRDGRHGLGQAYSTTDPHHLLNSRAERMSALEHDPHHFVRWTRSRGLNAAGADFLPRHMYGRYLRETLDDAENAHRVTRLRGDAVALTRSPLRVHLSDGGALDADAVVLATGNPAAATPIPITGERYIADPWAAGALARVGCGDVLIIGTGLTMVDVAVTLTRTAARTVYAISRHGLLPQAHSQPTPPCAPVLIPDGPLRLRSLLSAVRVATHQSGGDWRGVIDGLRPRVQELWARLPIDERRRFLTVLARYWEVHRHRIPPETASRVDGLIAAGRLRVLRGHVDRATPDSAGLTVRVSTDGTTHDLRVAWLVNATGPAFTVPGEGMLARLLADGLVRPGPLGLGLDADACGRVLDAAGRPDDRIVTLGPTLRGKLYETTAIPEIRAQAATLASYLISRER